jgi:hypothetical protein
MPAEHRAVGAASRRRLGALAGLLLLTACSADRIEQGVFHSHKGYEVVIPGGDWQVAADGRADLVLRHASEQAGMLADATCRGGAATRPLSALSRQLFFGLIDRSVVEEEPVAVGGRQGVRTVVRGHRSGATLRVEAIVLKDERCVYDFLYVAPEEHFEAGRPQFRTFVESFAAERER